MAVILRCCGVSKTYVIGNTTKKIIDNVSADVEDGAFLSIVGRSGSGKSTLLNLMCGLIRPDSGCVEISGQNLTALNEKQTGVFRSQRIGIVFQDNNLIDEFSVEDNILTPAYIAKLKPDTEYLNRLLDFTELLTHRDQKTGLLSGGQKQRTAIARALINKPKIIFADEPTGSLDSNSAEDVMRLFKEVNSVFGTTIIQVTHSDACAKVGTGIITLDDGKICLST